MKFKLYIEDKPFGHPHLLWHDWFAWHPVLAWASGKGHKIVWLENVKRRWNNSDSTWSYMEKKD